MPKRAAEAAERAEERRHRRLAIVAVRRRAQLAVAGLIDLHRRAVAQRDRRIREVGVGQDAVDVRRPSRPAAPASARIFSSASVSVCARAADDVAQVEGVGLQPRLGGDGLLDRRAADPQDLRLDDTTPAAPNFA